MDERDWVQRARSDVVYAAGGDVSTEPDNRERVQTAGKEQRLTVGCGDDDVSQRPTKAGMETLSD